MMHITEDTPSDMLTGAMDLTVHLPSGKTVKMSVERSTPMMDVLVLITTQYNLQVSRYAIEALGMAPTSSDYSDKVLAYRPNTPLGALDTQHIRIIPKLKAAPPPRPVKVAAHQPFESTFRLKVHLPKNQLYVIRVSRNIYLEDIMAKVCDDKNLDSRKYEFRHPGNLDQILDSKLTLSDYQITEIYLIIRGTLTAFSTNDIMALRREEEKKQMHTKAGGGVFNLIFKKGRNSLEYGSISSENLSVSPTHSDDSRSLTPPTNQAPIASLNKPTDQPKPPQRKRKPAPKPPSQVIDIKPSSSTEAVDPSTVNNNMNTNICHSRTSSDSSGYHEASILSDNLINNSSLPRPHHTTRPKTVIGATGSSPDHQVELRKGITAGIHRDHSKSTGNLMTLSSKSKSTMSLMTTGRKKKAAPLPPQTLSLPANNQSNIPMSLTLENSSPPIVNLDQQRTVADIDETSSESLDNMLMTTPSVAATESNISSLSTNHEQLKEPTPKVVNDREDTNAIPSKNDLEQVDWKYELPLPPTAFRDNDKDNFDNLTQYDTTTLASERFRGDSVVSNPELFEKLNKLKQAQSDTTTESVISTEDDKSIYNKLSLELLQKRKSLVYNRELATSLKSPEGSFKQELQDAVQYIKPKPKANTLRQTSGLPNFKITTYDEPKSKINIYEDDTIRSNQTMMMTNDISYKTRSLMRNQNEIAPVVRSGSFSINTWSTGNPLKRSTSQAALIHRRNAEEEEEEKELAKTTREMDVLVMNAGGLQSVGVMKQIRNSLQTPPVDNVDSKSPTNSDINVSKIAPVMTNGTTLPAPNKVVANTRRWSPPDISLGTWSDRPKSEVFLKRDSDYKVKGVNVLSTSINNNNTSTYKSGGVVVINSNNSQNHGSYNYEDSFMSRKNSQMSQHNNNNVSIKINGSEPISTSNESGNVTIRIGPTNTNTQSDSQQITYRKPFGNVNQSRMVPRPHSIAIDTNTNYDVSRRPVVTSATLKKTVTQINNNYSTTRPNSVYLVNNMNNNQSTTNNRKSWNALLTQGSLISSKNVQTSVFNNTSDSSYNTNVNVPFSQLRLKRTESNKILTQVTANGTQMGFGRVLDKVPIVNERIEKRQLNGTSSTYCPPPPPPPQILMSQRAPRQQIHSTEDPRSALLSAIQNFGGKKGLRSIRT